MSLGLRGCSGLGDMRLTLNHIYQKIYAHKLGRSRCTILTIGIFTAAQFSHVAKAIVVPVDLPTVNLAGPRGLECEVA
jgi:hypothetical protein